MVLHSGNIAEMVTGEGKTLVATLPAYLNALDGQGRARRHGQRLPGPPRHGMDGPAVHGPGADRGRHLCRHGRRSKSNRPTSCDITYGTNNEFGFDYLRDNMKPAARGDDRYPKSQQQVQRALHYAIVDEVDNILIDEARTPLIISGPAYDDVQALCQGRRDCPAAARRTCTSRSRKKSTRSI